MKILLFFVISFAALIAHCFILSLRDILQTGWPNNLDDETASPGQLLEQNRKLNAMVTRREKPQDYRQLMQLTIEFRIAITIATARCEFGYPSIFLSLSICKMLNIFTFSLNPVTILKRREKGGRKRNWNKIHSLQYPYFCFSH